MQPHADNVPPERLAANVLRDGHGRAIRSLRISVTDRCNFRCTYCMPVEGVPFVDRCDILSFEEIAQLAAIGARLGIRRLRLTGGEPLLRRDLPSLVAMLSAIEEVEEVALTTNGVLLDRFAGELANAGLDRVNVSIDGLAPSTFARMTRTDLGHRAWRGVTAALEAGLTPVRINTVVVAGDNDQELDAWVGLTCEHDVTVRFLELMPVGEGAALTRRGGFCDLTAARERLAERHGLVRDDRAVGNGPARYWRVPGAPGRVGFITPMSDSYCGSCSRMRLSSTGFLRPCLAHEVGVDARAALRAGGEERAAAAFAEAARIKPWGHRWAEGQETSTGMSTIGG